MWPQETYIEFNFLLFEINMSKCKNCVIFVNFSTVGKARIIKNVCNTNSKMITLTVITRIKMKGSTEKWQNKQTEDTVYQIICWFK